MRLGRRSRSSGRRRRRRSALLRLRALRGFGLRALLAEDEDDLVLVQAGPRVGRLRAYGPGNRRALVVPARRAGRREGQVDFQPPRVGYIEVGKSAALARV